MTEILRTMTMIYIFSLEKSESRAFDDFKELAFYIKWMEKKKLFDDRPGFGQSMWSFTHHTPERVALLYYTLQKRYDIDKIREAFLKEQPLVEICKGDYQNIVEIPVEPWMSIEEMQEDWCHEYCEAHGLKIVYTEE